MEKSEIIEQFKKQRNLNKWIALFIVVEGFGLLILAVAFLLYKIAH
jgi:hypothetical protein